MSEIEVVRIRTGNTLWTRHLVVGVTRDRLKEYQAMAGATLPCEDCYPIAKWESMTDEELEAIGLDPKNLPGPPGKAWEVKYPWLIIRCEGCGGVLAELDVDPREEAAIWY